MPKDYSNGKIYSVRFYDNDKLIYIGSTIQSLAVRFGGHKRDFGCSLYKYIEEHYSGDFKCCYMELIEPFGCNNKDELNKREGEFIRRHKADENFITINKLIAGRTDKEYYIDNANKIKEKMKEYYINNVENIKEKRKEYYIDNAKNITEKRKQYLVDNANNIKEKRKEYYIDNADNIKEKKKQYYIENIENIKEKKKQYRFDNKEKIQEYNKQYYIDNIKQSRFQKAE